MDKIPSDKIPLADYCHRNSTRMVDETVSIGHTLCSLKTEDWQNKFKTVIFVYNLYIFSFLWIMFYLKPFKS